MGARAGKKPPCPVLACWRLLLRSGSARRSSATPALRRCAHHCRPAPHHHRHNSHRQTWTSPPRQSCRRGPWGPQPGTRPARCACGAQQDGARACVPTAGAAWWAVAGRPPRPLLPPATVHRRQQRQQRQQWQHARACGQQPAGVPPFPTHTLRPPRLRTCSPTCRTSPGARAGSSSSPWSTAGSRCARCRCPPPQSRCRRPGTCGTGAGRHGEGGAEQERQAAAAGSSAGAWRAAIALTHRLLPLLLLLPWPMHYACRAPEGHQRADDAKDVGGVHHLHLAAVIGAQQLQHAAARHHQLVRLLLREAAVDGALRRGAGQVQGQAGRA